MIIAMVKIMSKTTVKVSSIYLCRLDLDSESILFVFCLGAYLRSFL